MSACVHPGGLSVPGCLLRAASTSSVASPTNAKTGITGTSSMAAGTNKTTPSGKRMGARIKTTTDVRTASGILMAIETSNCLATLTSSCAGVAVEQGLLVVQIVRAHSVDPIKTMNTAPQFERMTRAQNVSIRSASNYSAGAERRRQCRKRRAVGAASQARRAMYGP